MSLEEKCVGEGVKGCGSCNGYDKECVDYLPELYGEMYEATKIDVVMESYQRTKKVIKNGASSLLRLWKKS